MSQEAGIRGALAYRSDIEGMRALAVLLVLIFHFRLLSFSEAGFIGVDVFFVISGFLITSILVRQLDEGAFGIGKFYLARIRRLAPALVAVLMLVLAVGAGTLFADDLVELSRQALASQLYVANLYFWKHVNYFGLRQEGTFLLHMWSLAVEEQFYLAYPIALWWLHRYRRSYLWGGIALGLVGSFALNLALVAQKPEATFYLFPTRAWELLAGALVPAIAAQWRRPRLVDEALGALGLAALVVAVLCYRKDIPFPGTFVLLPVGGAVCLLLGGAGGSTLTAKLLGLGPITYIGRISYPLYLVHWPVNIFAGRILGDGYGLAWRLAMFAGSALLAATLYHVVENPIQRRSWLGGDRRLLAGYGLGVLATASLVAAVVAGEGLPSRYPAEVSRLAAYVNDKSPALAECEHEGGAKLRRADFCRIGVATVKPRWLVYGDSHAWAAHSAFDRLLVSKGEGGLFLFRSSCPPLLGVNVFGDRGGCLSFNRAVVEFLAADRDIANVVLVSVWRQATEARLTSSADVLPTREQSIALFDRSFASTLDRLQEAGKRIYLWEPVPGAKQDVPQALARAALQGRSADIEFTRAQYLEENRFFFSALDRNREKIAVLLSPSDALCGSGMCAVVIDGVPAYFDDFHIAKSPADFWVRMMQRGEQESMRASMPQPAH